ncbi:hypothetical protein Q6348_11765 [Isoptericola sp. b441]|uniref:Uncharacterized protein n=1 Tax=Actinotalea lenta TaxID=3064654 RepID=A0ABT9DAD8_9CELL|nr:MULTISPECIES: hypothetical protein [unclassified Isoptericola]MDO8107872.1 hypothetical protein [Isoptericola sp. b441]MDO8120458.1 hypothetical protein [Isoptericola sp. b490]
MGGPAAGPAGHTPDPARLATVVAEREAEVRTRLADAVGDGPMCRVDGARARPAKHWEGRAAALAQLRRALRRGGDPGQELADLRAQWTSQRAIDRGEAWRVYTDAGLDALTELEDL